MSVIYKCIDCERIFEEPKTIPHHVLYGLAQDLRDTTEWLEVCPFCDGQGIMQVTIFDEIRLHEDGTGESVDEDMDSSDEIPDGKE